MAQHESNTFIAGRHTHRDDGLATPAAKHQRSNGLHGSPSSSTAKFYNEQMATLYAVKAQNERVSFERAVAEQERQARLQNARNREAEKRARRLAEEKEKDANDLGESLLGALRQKVESRIEAELRETMRACAEKETPAFTRELQQEREDELKCQLRQELAPVVAAELRVELFRSIEHEMRITLRGPVEAALRDMLRPDIESELRISLHDSVEAHLRVALRESVEKQLREDFAMVVAAEHFAKGPEKEEASQRSQEEAREEQVQVVQEEDLQDISPSSRGADENVELGVRLGDLANDAQVDPDLDVAYETFPPEHDPASPEKLFVETAATDTLVDEHDYVEEQDGERNEIGVRRLQGNGSDEDQEKAVAYEEDDIDEEVPKGRKRYRETGEEFSHGRHSLARENKAASPSFATKRIRYDNEKETDVTEHAINEVLNLESEDYSSGQSVNDEGAGTGHLEETDDPDHTGTEGSHGVAEEGDHKKFGQDGSLNLEVCYSENEAAYDNEEGIEGYDYEDDEEEDVGLPRYPDPADYTESEDDEEEDEDGEEEDEEEEVVEEDGDYYSDTVPPMSYLTQPASVIANTNTEETAFVIDDSDEDDNQKTAVENDDDEGSQEMVADSAEAVLHRAGEMDAFPDEETNQEAAELGGDQIANWVAGEIEAKEEEQSY